MLTCENLSYKTRFHGLGFSLTPGALLAIYGTDAIGLLMLMAGKLAPTTGNVTFEDRPIKRNPEYRDLSLYIGLEKSLRSWETVEKAITRLAKKGGGATELVEASLRYWGLDKERHTKCGVLAPALQRRVILTQLLTLPRPIWLLVNPETALDAEGLNMLDTLIANRCNQDGIVVLATERPGFMAPLPELRMSDFQ